ncbi:MBL fold metallo-hydrolase [Geminicoccus roseus]|uniref:MBL fold metallo-hydrolase n=1 Tax=Geminicoccus roseus TaxID=404900 RepID=UPI0004249E7B|nr:MBL fold metallo-hydrolase [Geminicoccus roseus]
MQQLGSTMRVFRPFPGLVAFYDGRIEGMRLHSDKPNWLDDGAFALGVCTYALVDGEDALVYDTHISLQHARVVRRTLVEAGVRRIRVVLSHWHVDHVAGNEVFQDCEILAHRLTAEALDAHRQELEAGDPPIRPLVMPTRTYEDRLELQVGQFQVELRHADVHSLDGTVLLLPEHGLMLAGDTLEDPVTYVVEPERLAVHLRGLEQMARWNVRRILPNHGALETIEAGGYGPELIDATRSYVARLLRVREEPALAEADLPSFCRPAFDSGAIHYFPAYEAVHRRNVQAVI